MRKRPPTIRDVANQAGVSVATVSRVMNGSPKVRHDTKATVEAAIAKLGYWPSWLARDLRQDRTGRVLVLFPSLHSPVMSAVFKGIDEVAQANDYYSLICPTAKNHGRETQLLALLFNRVVDGVIFFGTTLDAAALGALASKHSIVQCAEWQDATVTARVSIDDYQAAVDLTNHLLHLGHRKLGMITNRDEFSGRLREKGFRDTLRRSRVKLDESFVVQGDYEFASGRTGAHQLLTSRRRPSGLVCVSDVVAAGAITEARVQGLRVPEEVAIAGFDDSPEAMMVVPPITTIRQPFTEIGRRAMELVLEQIRDGDRATSRQLYLAHELVIRESTVAESAS